LLRSGEIIFKLLCRYIEDTWSCFVNIKSHTGYFMLKTKSSRVFCNLTNSCGGVFPSLLCPH
jgi:hypothetical protein